MTYSHSIAAQEQNDARSESLIIEADKRDIFVDIPIDHDEPTNDDQETEIETAAVSRLDILIDTLRNEEGKTNPNHRRIRRLERQIESRYTAGEVPVYQDVLHPPTRDAGGMLWA